MDLTLRRDPQPTLPVMSYLDPRARSPPDPLDDLWLSWTTSASTTTASSPAALVSWATLGPPKVFKSTILGRRPFRRHNLSATSVFSTTALRHQLLRQEPGAPLSPRARQPLHAPGPHHVVAHAPSENTRPKVPRSIHSNVALHFVFGAIVAHLRAQPTPTSREAMLCFDEHSDVAILTENIIK